MTAIPAAVALTGLTRRFGDVSAVCDLSFEVSKGELFGIVGPDGAGKTTTLRMLAGVLRPTAGDAVVCGVSVLHDPEGVKPHIAYMSQRFGLYGDLTVRENIDFYADLYGVPRHAREERLKKLYEFSSLGPFQKRLTSDLSGGMKQKLSLCCALIHQPEVMLLDEPTFGVDPISRRDLWLIVHEMVAGGTTVLVSTAYLDEAERCDRVALLHGGREIALDTPDELRQLLAQNMYSVRTSEPRRTASLLNRGGYAKRAALFGDTVHITFDNRELDWPAAEALLRANQIEVLAAGPTEPSLEDVFIDLVVSQDDGNG